VERVPPLNSNCSRGWTKEIFETVVGKSVDVKPLTSIKRGDKECLILVRA